MEEGYGREQRKGNKMWWRSLLCLLWQRSVGCDKAVAMIDTVNEGDAWDYWGKVYESPGLRSELLQAVQDEPRLGHLLDRYQKGQSTKLVFSNVANCTNLEMKNLLEAELGRATVNHIRFAKNNTATVHFYLTSVAQTAKMKFNQRRFRGSTLQVRFWDDQHKAQPPAKPQPTPQTDVKPIKEFVPADVPPITKSKQKASKKAKKEMAKKEKADESVTREGEAASLPMQKKAMKCANEWDELCQMSLVPLLSVLLNEGPLYVFGSRCKQVIGQLCAQDQVLAVWPLGLLRLCSAVVFHGAWLCTPDQNPPVQQQPVLSFREPWEPMTPDSIRTAADITSYMRAALCHFGPLDGRDRRLSVLKAQLAFPFDKMPLLTHIQTNAHIFCKVHDTVFLLNDHNHRNAARKLITTYTSLNNI